MKTILMRFLTCSLFILVVAAGLRGQTGYSPQQVRHAYGLDQIKATATGQGQIIAIITVYGNPNTQSDLNTFCSKYGLPNIAVKQYFPQGQTTGDSGWNFQETRDVEWAHAIAPGATIAVVAASSPTLPNLYSAVDYAVSTVGAEEVCVNWVTPEYSTETSDDSHFQHPGVTFFAPSGNQGAYTEGLFGPPYPAASPYVIGVGGTSLNLDGSGNYLSEAAWSSGGGGTSLYENVPNYQVGFVSGSKRGVPDVSYVADPNTGLPVYSSQYGWIQTGGTGIGVPQWAAIYAIANALRSPAIKNPASMLYSLASYANYYAGSFHDVISGGNGVYSAAKGYDLVTGLGSPVGNQLVLALANGGCWTASAGGVWANNPIPTLTGSGSFAVNFDAYTTNSPTNAVVALSNGAQTAYTNFACLVRFNPSGFIDAYNGSKGYQAASQIPYSALVYYHFSLVVNPAAKTYSVYVTPSGGSQLTVGTNFAFRTTGTTLNNYGAYVAPSGTGSLTVCNFFP